MYNIGIAWILYLLLCNVKQSRTQSKAKRKNSEINIFYTTRSSATFAFALWLALPHIRMCVCADFASVRRQLVPFHLIDFGGGRKFSG